MPKTCKYDQLTTMNAWQAAAIEKALEYAIQKGLLHKEHGERTLEQFSRFSNPGCVIRFEEKKKEKYRWRTDNHGRRYYEINPEY